MDIKDKRIQELQERVYKKQQEIQRLNADNWISVDDRLPENGLTQVVLISDSYGIRTSYFRPDGIFYDWYNGMCRMYENVSRPTHWMPLPTAPEDSDE